MVWIDSSKGDLVAQIISTFHAEGALAAWDTRLDGHSVAWVMEYRQKYASYSGKSSLNYLPLTNR